MPRGAVLASGVAIALIAAGVVVATPYLTAHPHALYVALVVAFLAMIAAGVPVGFVLAVIGIVCAKASGSGDLMGVVMNAQRGAGGFVFLALPFFILAGFIMDRADVGARIVEFVSSLIGHMRGGLLQVMVVGVYIASCISGSKAADMATVGLPMNRKLEEHGYPPEERAAILAASAAMAESVPPSHRADPAWARPPRSRPARCSSPASCRPRLIGVMLMITVRLRAKRAGWKATPRASRREIAQAGRKAILPLMIPVILLGGIVGGIGTPTEVSTFAVLYSLVLGLGYRKIDGKTLWSCLTQRHAAERHDLLHGERRHGLLVGADARRHHHGHRVDDRRPRPVCVPAGGDRHHGADGHDARKLRHHRDPRAAAAAGRAAARHQHAAIRHRDDRGVRHRHHPAADRHRALRRLRDQRRQGREGQQAAALLPAGARSPACCWSWLFPVITTILPRLLDFKY